MGSSRMMEKRGHHICQVGEYQVRQKVTSATNKRQQGKWTLTPGSSEVFLYKAKNKLEGNIKTVQLAAQKAYDMLKENGKEGTVSKKVIKKYGIVL
jgi:hypothetical protein